MKRSGKPRGIMAKITESYGIPDDPAPSPGSAALIRKYGLQPLRDKIEELRGIDIAQWDELELERICCAGSIVGWDWLLAIFASSPDKPRDRAEFGEWHDWHPPGSVGAFAYGTGEPEGHLVRFIDLAFQGSWVWSKQVRVGTGVHRVINHWAVRYFYDLVNRTPVGKHRAAYNLAAGPKSCGKTATAAIYALTMFLVFRTQMTVKVCSSTQKGSESRIWGQVVEFYRKSVYNTKKDQVLDKKIGEFRVLTGQEKRIIFCPTDADDKMVKNTLTGIELVAIRRGADGQAAVDSLIGIKAGLKLLVVDEANAVDDSIFHEDLHSNWMEAPHFAQIVFMMNPSHKHRKSVSFYQPKLGWTSEDYHMDSPGWATLKGGWVTNFNGLDTPNRHWRHIKDEKRKAGSPSAPFSFLMSRTSIERDEAQTGGMGSAAFARMTIGFLVDEEHTDTIWTPRYLEQHGGAGRVEWTGDGTYPLIGCDPAFGGDKFSVCIGEIGYGWTTDRKKRVFLEVRKFRNVPFIVKEKGTPEQGQIQFMMELAASNGIGVESIAADCTGTSTGFVFPFETAMKGQIHRVYFAASPSERQAEPHEMRTAKERYDRAASELAYSARAWLPFIRGLTDDELLDQGCERTYEIRSGDKIVVEPKVDFKARVGYSPDKFDSFTVLLDLARTMGLGSDILVHPKVAARRHGAQWRIETRASYDSAEERVGLANYGVAA